MSESPQGESTGAVRRLSARAAGRARLLAHELANALMLVTGFADLLALHPRVREDPTLAARVDQIARAAAQCGDILGELHRTLREDPVLPPDRT